MYESVIRFMFISSTIIIISIIGFALISLIAVEAKCCMSIIESPKTSKRIFLKNPHHQRILLPLVRILLFHAPLNSLRLSSLQAPQNKNTPTHIAKVRVFNIKIYIYKFYHFKVDITPIKLKIIFS